MPRGTGSEQERTGTSTLRNTATLSLVSVRARRLEVSIDTATAPELAQNAKEISQTRRRDVSRKLASAPSTWYQLGDG